ncbi:MAG: hypothetical protein DWQ06_12155 [Calditrichaeota bacterium]|nr:MAG: hypothetical protein DWQ06_12155 [Calditrichota bacterium]
MEKYKIVGYPTILLLKPDGEELDRIVGANKPEKFLVSLEGFRTGSTYLSNYLTRLEDSPNDVDLMFKIAEKYTDRGDSENAKEYFSQVVETSKNDEQKATASYELAMFDLKEDKTESVSKFANEFGETELGIRAGMKLAGYFEKKKELEKAYKTYWKVVEKNPRNANALNAFAWFSAENEMHLEKALEAAIVAVKVSEKSPQIVDTLAEVYFRMGKNKEAIESIQMAIDKDPEDSYYKEQLEKFKKAQTANK